jgi:predicted nucleotidyltransferase
LIIYPYAENFKTITGFQMEGEMDLERIKKTLLTQKQKLRKLGINSVGIIGLYPKKNAASGHAGTNILLDLSVAKEVDFFAWNQWEQEFSEMLNTGVDLFIRRNMGSESGEKATGDVEFIHCWRKYFPTEKNPSANLKKKNFDGFSFVE